MRLRWRFSLLAAFIAPIAPSASCSFEAPTTLADIRIESATLSDVVFAGFGIFGSLRAGSAQLHIESLEGESFDVDVRMNATISGGLMEMGFGAIPGDGVYDLSQVDDANGSHLLGPFDGLALSGSMFVGGGVLDLHNDRRAEVNISGFEPMLGMSLIAGHAWTSIDVEPEGDCANGNDDDVDGTADCLDLDCRGTEPCNEAEGGEGEGE